ncbi:hypothetical protein MCUN1_003014 [Malassezia cuniculi]|uniref:Uncharacterized protein n=1 Tax=Malassezia cuniculi TaxID=948313 RepID=A0AAF0EX46_9BASI|nr:hypothetical protein MCUN1_003014 [Malassezia cuniculi]
MRVHTYQVDIGSHSITVDVSELGSDGPGSCSGVFVWAGTKDAAGHGASTNADGAEPGPMPPMPADSSASNGASAIATAHAHASGSLMRDFAVAVAPARGKAALGTAISHGGSLSLPMAQRLGIPQLFLALDLPPALLPSVAGDAGANGRLTLELGIRKACEAALGQS